MKIENKSPQLNICSHRIIEFQSGLFPRVIFSFFDQAINFHFVISLLKINIEQIWIHRWKAGKTCVITVRNHSWTPFQSEEIRQTKLRVIAWSDLCVFYFAILLFYVTIPRRSLRISWPTGNLRHPLSTACKSIFWVFFNLLRYHSLYLLEYLLFPFFI